MEVYESGTVPLGCRLVAVGTFDSRGWNFDFEEDACERELGLEGGVVEESPVFQAVVLRSAGNCA